MMRQRSLVSTLAVAGLAVLLAPRPAAAQVIGTYAPSRFATGNGYYSPRAAGYSPIFLTSINYPGIYGSYTYGPSAMTYNVTPTFQTRPETPVERPLEEVLARPALIDVYLPADATLSFQGVRMSETGSAREFQSPPLEPGRSYTYDVRATWKGEDGREVVRSRRLTVRAGDHLEVDLNRALMPRAEEDQRPTLRTQPLPLLRDARPVPRD